MPEGSFRRCCGPNSSLSDSSRDGDTGTMPVTHAAATHISSASLSSDHSTEQSDNSRFDNTGETSVDNVDIPTASPQSLNMRPITDSLESMRIKLEASFKRILELSINSLKTELNGRLSDIETRLTAIEDAPPCAEVDNFAGQKILSEFENRCKHARNVIAYNFNAPETDSNDLDAINGFLSTVVYCQPARRAIRFGKSINGKPRPLKIIFDSERDAQVVLKHKNDFAKKNVIFKNDLTLNQRQYLKSVQAELNCRITEGQTDLTIKYIDNIPTIVSKND